MPSSPKHRLDTLAQSRELVVAGLMTGTSMDGLDVALCRVGPAADPIELIHGRTVPMPGELRSGLEAALEGDLVAMARMDTGLGAWMADALAEVVGEAGVTLDLVGSHGQTVYHEHGVTTLQIGEPGYIAARLDCVVASDFRRADIVLGGCGAPLVPIFDRLVLGQDDETVVAINIGGISNLTVLPPARTSNQEPCAFDCGPGNMVLDRIVECWSGGQRLLDENGEAAARGIVDTALLADLMAHPFLALAPPRSAGREQFGKAFTDALIERVAPGSDGEWQNLLATATAWSADAITTSLRAGIDRHSIDRIYVGGGGARNATLMHRLEAALGQGVLRDLSEAGIDADLKEAMAFALLARLLIDGHAGNVPRATGAARPGLLGRLTFPP